MPIPEYMRARWLAEIGLMRNTFPLFSPVADAAHIGFAGQLAGRSGRAYGVEIRAPLASYPAKAPKIYIRPGVGPNRYLDGSLCVNRPWRPGRDTFAQQVLYAADYLAQHG